MNWKKLGRTLICLLIVCTLIFNISPIRAEAAAAEGLAAAWAAMGGASVAAPALVVVAGAIVAFGLCAAVESQELVLRDLAQDCVDALTAAGTIVGDTVEGWILDGKSYFAEDFLQAIREWLWTSGALESSLLDGAINGSVAVTAGTPITFQYSPTGSYIFTPSVDGTFYRFWRPYNYGYGGILFIPASGSSFSMTYASPGGTAYNVGVESTTISGVNTWYYLAEYHLSDSAFRETFKVGAIYCPVSSRVPSDSTIIEAVLGGSISVPAITTPLDLTVSDVVAPPDSTIETGYESVIVTPGIVIELSPNEPDPEDPNKTTLIPFDPIHTTNDIEDMLKLDQETAWDGETELEPDTSTEDPEGSTTPPTDPGSDIDPDPTTGTNTDPDTGTSGNPSENVNKFKLDLKEFFPFCIPWDIAAFLGLFQAEPEAPKFEWDIEFPYMDEPWHLVVDLSPWNDTAQLLRRLELVAFIVGLAMVTRERYLRG